MRKLLLQVGRRLFYFDFPKCCRIVKTLPGAGVKQIFVVKYALELQIEILGSIS